MPAKIATPAASLTLGGLWQHPLWHNPLWMAARQTLWRLPLLVMISLLVFVVLRVVPVDPVTMLLPPGSGADEVASLTRELGLDQPLPTQFMLWLGSAVQGDFGISIQAGSAVSEMVLRALPMTLELLLFGLFTGISLGLVFGMLTFYCRDSWLERVLLGANGILIALPDYLWALLLILLLGVGLQWLPFLGPLGANLSVDVITGSRLLDSLLTTNWAAFGSALQHLVLPALALGFCIATPVARVLYSSLCEVYQEDYIQAARLRGLSERSILFNHALRNAALPTISLIGVQTSMIIGSTLLVESIFGLPGIGNLMLQAMKSFDLQVIQAIALVYAVTVQLVNLITDWLAWSLNPRLRSNA